ncbi:unnamed protein product [Arctia plantaginis]|uniref:Uncharacterized protein n=1 Tax=Arctia plantaginis TaxID=874455 RepID=A0A8S0YTV5_ARCPL|nr:unnamed protein product [Arctia plantaginis]
MEVFGQKFPRFDPLPQTTDETPNNPMLNMEDDTNTKKRPAKTTEIDTWDIFVRANGMPPELCNQTLCAAPCPGAAAPPRCPPVIPYCHSGCACTYSCEVAIVLCFEIHSCLETRRRHFFTRNRRKSTVPMN